MRKRSLEAIASVLLLAIAGTILAQASDKEAETEILKFYTSKLTKCGDAYYVKFRQYPASLTQFNKLLVTVIPTRLNRADMLNGIEWKGSALLDSPLRDYSANTKKWGEWVEPLSDRSPPITAFSMNVVTRLLLVDAQKIHGKWQIAFSDARQATILRVNCANPLDFAEAKQGYMCSALSKATSVWGLANGPNDSDQCARALKFCSTSGATDCVVTFEGSYWQDRSNTVTAQCAGGTRDFTGVGAQVIQQAFDFAVQSKWYDCTFRVKL